ncbi:MAG: hypothetical protein M3Y36_04095, partial [Actinomycetota bacterium]|nr:hypothetical protein [Actinomycetota bacterium]
QWDRKHWGAGGEEFGWWCTEEPAAFSGHRPVYEEMAGEIAALVGAPIAEMVTAYLTERASGDAIPLPHPVLRQA